MSYTNFDSFKDAPWFNQGFSVIVGGSGGIGSWLTLLLARIGCNIYLYDFDTIERRNLGGQLFKYSSVGSNKTVEVKNTVKDFTDITIHTFEKYDESSPTSNIVFSGFDNMKARRIMFDKWYENQLSKEVRPAKEVNIFIDGRLSAETGIIYAVKSKRDAERYISEFKDDSEIDDLPCTFRGTSHSACMIASLMTAVFVNQVSNKISGDLRDVPFKTTYELPLFSFQSFQ